MKTMETKLICKRDYEYNYTCDDEIKKQIDNAVELDVLVLKIDNNKIIKLIILKDHAEEQLLDILRNGM